MTNNTSGQPEDWSEVDIMPADPAHREALLLDVVDRLIHETLSDRIESWHFFWEDDPINIRHLRLRVLWLPSQGSDGKAALTASLDAAEANRDLWHWYPGRHGVAGGEYEGEAADYDGPEMWRATYRDWEAGSDLALALLKLEAQGRLVQGRQYHLERRVHLHSNRLGLSYLDEGRLYLALAIGYFREAGLSANGLQALEQIKDAIDQAVSRQSGGP